MTSTRASLGVGLLVVALALPSAATAQTGAEGAEEPTPSETGSAEATEADTDPAEGPTEQPLLPGEIVEPSPPPVYADPTPPAPVTAPLSEPDPRDDAAPDEATPDDSQREPEFGVRATAELGFLGVLDHDIRLGSDGTDIDYPSDGGQSNLYFFARLSLELDIWRQHHITFLYQPLEIATETVLRRDLRIDGLDFPAGTPVRFFYGFPFFRLSWDFDVLDAPNELLAFGLGLQLRNADISFESLDGSLFRSRNDVGPVPLLRARGRFDVGARFFFGFEVDGFYAPISVLNGSDSEVTGAILDASLRFGWRFVDHGDLFLNVRYLAGGAVGSGDPTPTSDGEQSNWLHFLSVSLGATIDSRP